MVRLKEKIQLLQYVGFLLLLMAIAPIDSMLKGNVSSQHYNDTNNEQRQ